MPRFFFNLTDGHVEHDDKGTELETIRAARIQAVLFASESLKNDPEHVWTGQEMRVEVTDESGSLLFTVVTMAIDSPALTRQLKV